MAGGHPAFGVAGLGMGLAYSPLALIVLREAPPETQGAATSALSLTDSLGTALGTGHHRRDRRGQRPVDRRAGRRASPSGSSSPIAVGLGGLVLTGRLRPRTRPGAGLAALAGVAAVVDGRDACGRLRALSAAAHRRRGPDQGGPDIVSAEELRAKIREVPDFPKPGILFYDITTLLKDAAAYKEAIDLMLAPYAGEQIDIVVGMESRGFIFSAPMAYQLDAGLVPVRKLGKLPAETITVEYALEYGSNTLEIHRDAIAARPEGPDRRRPAGDRRHGPRDDRARRAAQGRGRRPRLPGRARVPQGSRPARRTPRHERHQVLTAVRSEARRLADPPTDPEHHDPDADPAAGRVRPMPRRAAAAPADLGRRRFFRAFAGELIQTAATMAGAAQALQQVSAEAAGAILNPAGAAAARLAAATGRGRPAPRAGRRGFRTPFREDGGVALPDRPAAAARRARRVPVRSAGEVAYAIREMVVRGAPAIGQVAAIGLAMSAENQRDGRPYARKATHPRLGQRPDQRRGRRRSTCAGRSSA